MAVTALLNWRQLGSALTLFGLLFLSAVAQAQNPFKAPLYWSPYEYNIKTDNYIPETEWAANIDWMEKNLKDSGYKMICIDGWGDDGQFNQDGYRTSHSRQWQHDYAWWSANLQSRGMTLGMYNNPLWIIKSAADAGVKIKGTNIPLASIMNEGENAQWFKWVQVDRPGAEQYVKGYIQYYADMGVKYLRVDFLSWFEDGYDRNIGVVGPKRPRAHYETALRWMREACDANGMFLSLVMPHLYQEAELELKYGHMVRINEDAGDGQWWKFSDVERGKRRNGWSQYANAFDGFVYWSHIAGRGKMILDGDFLRINTFQNDEEKKSVVSLNLLAGGPVTISDQYSTIGNNLWVYQNEELLALNRDGFVGKPLSNDPTSPLSQIWKGQLSNGDWVVGLFNRETTPQTRSINFAAELGLNGNPNARDLWQHNDLGRMKQYSVSVPPHGCVILKVSKSDPTQATAPTFSLSEGIFTTAQTVVLSSVTPGAKIYYSLSATAPASSFQLYTGPIGLTGTATIRAYTQKDGLRNSPLVSATYLLNLPGQLPMPWKSQDIGTVGVSGSASFASDTFTNTAAGADIEGPADSFRFIYQPITGDATLQAQVVSLTAGQEWAKAGLMIRSSLDGGSPNAFVGVTPTNGVIFQRREEVVGPTSGTVTSGVAVPVWLRIQRVGTQITVYRSVNGTNWLPVGQPLTLPVGTTAYAGMAFTSHQEGTLGAATFSHVELGQAGTAASAPTFSLVSGTYTTVQSVALSSTTNGAFIRYTTDGTVPGGTSPLYTEPIPLNATATIRAYAQVEGKVNSPIVSSSYVLTLPGNELVSGAAYTLKARHSGKALDVIGGSLENGTLLHQWDAYNDFPSQQWVLTNAGDGYFTLTNGKSGKVLDVAGGSTDEGASVHQWDSYTLSSQQWRLSKVEEGYYKIENRNSGKALDVYGASADNGGLVKQYTYGGNANQQWRLERVRASILSTKSSTSEVAREGVEVYPNPASTALHLQLPLATAEVVILNAAGDIVYRGKVTRAEPSLDVSHFASGLYLIRISLPDGSRVSRRVMISH
ncbi:hypothetical protein GCM10027348_39180 [Hymenobacter tenuis]